MLWSSRRPANSSPSLFYSWLERLFDWPIDPDEAATALYLARERP